MTDVIPAPEWSGPSNDPNDEQFGDIVRSVNLNSADTVEAVLVGEPYDGAVIGRRGAAGGPSAIRKALASVKTHHFDAGPVSTIGDLGNIEIPDGPTSDVQDAVSGIAGQVHESDALPVFVGGDNSLSYANARPLLDSGSLGVVSFDAHLDCREVVREPTSGTPYRQLHEDGLDRLAVVGARHFETSTAYAHYLVAQGGSIVTAEEVGEDVVQAVDCTIDSLDDVEQVYVSVDIDVLDAAHAPGASAPTPGGLIPRELFRALRLVVRDDRFAGFEIVECAPNLDAENRTVETAARTIAHVLAVANPGGSDA